jgi:hypothetical protein
VAAYAPGVLADPVNVITALVVEVEPTLSRAAVAGTVAGVAGGRAKRRRLAQALLDRPALLTDGRSPAPRAAGDLLIALRAAGATGIAAPACAGCGKPLQLVADRHGHAAIGDQGTSRWLFPGGQPGRPISSYQLNERLRHLGLHPGQDRSTALFQLAADLPAALLARMLGIHITVAVAWQRASSGDWTSYAADVSRRTRT